MKKRCGFARPKRLRKNDAQYDARAYAHQKPVHIDAQTGVNFTIILQAAFTSADPKSAKKLFFYIFFCTFGICS